MKKIILIVAGGIFLCLGIIGIVLPVLPTTPFILLAAGCFMRSSRRLYAWLTDHRILGPYIDNWCRFHAVTKKSKLISIILLWTVMLGTIIFGVSVLWLRLMLLCVALAVTIHLLLLKTLTPEMLERKIETREPSGQN